MSSQTPKSQKNILDLPPEILRMIFQRISATKDVKNCQKACEVYTDPLISNITSLIQFENEGTILFSFRVCSIKNVTSVIFEEIGLF